MPAKAWSVEEVEATIASYFEMLRLELTGRPYNKSEFNARLRQFLDSRSKAAVEYKFQNVSAVLVNHGQVYIKGYLPAQNYQHALEASVLEWLENRDQLDDVVDSSPVLNPVQGSIEVPAFSMLLTGAPEPTRAARSTSTVGIARKIDFVQRDAANRALGLRGEEFALELEQRRLHDDERRPDLARRIR